MSYQVLARKWRPQQFSQLVGQEHVKTALTHALNQNRLHHAYLFTGTRGVGKTTIARIFAKSLNCEQGVTATPCGVCSACREIDQGFFVDLLEIDAASRTKVEDTRDLLDNVQYAPSRGRYKVYLIDEVHMLSKHSFNALLKTLEEPPPHVKFLLATTDPQKLPITVLSRCLQFSLKALTQQQIKQHLSHVLEQEQIPAQDEALALLARAAKGSLRDSLSLTDQAIAQTNGQIELGPVREMLGYLEQSWAELLLQTVLNRDLAQMQQHLYQLISSHAQFQSVLDDMLALLHLAALSQFQLNASELALTESAFVRAVAKSQSAEQIQLYYQLLLSGKKDLPYAPDARTGLEMALLRAIAFVPAKIGSTEPVPMSGRSAALSAAALPQQTQTVTDQTTFLAVQAKPADGMAASGEPLASAGHCNNTPNMTESYAEHNAAAEYLTSSLQVEDLQEFDLQDQYMQNQDLQYQQLVAAQETAVEAPTIATSTATNNNPSFDPVTASIMARRGLKLEMPPPEAAAKKSERQLAPVADKSNNEQTANAAAAKMSPALLPAAAESIPTTQQAEPAAPSASPALTVTPLAGAAMTDALSATEGSDNSQLTDVALSAALQQGVAPSHLPIVEPSTESMAATELDVVTGAQAEIFAAAPTEVGESDPDSEYLDPELSWQNYALAESSQPIRHALLDSVPVQQANIDFASEIPTVIETSVAEVSLSFDGEITAANFALRHASQVDEWAATIDRLPIGGLMRLFLLHSQYQLQDDCLQLQVAQSQQHLDTERNRQQLLEVLSQAFGQSLQLQIEFCATTPRSPQALQQQIDAARQRYVLQVLQQDPFIRQLQQQFAAQWQTDSLIVF